MFDWPTIDINLLQQTQERNETFIHPVPPSPNLLIPPSKTGPSYATASDHSNLMSEAPFHWCDSDRRTMKVVYFSGRVVR